MREELHFYLVMVEKGFMYMALGAEGELCTLFTLVQISKMNKKLWFVNCKILFQKSPESPFREDFKNHSLQSQNPF